MKILQFNANEDATWTALAAHMANIILQKQYFDYSGKLLKEPIQLPAVIYDEVEYQIYTPEVLIIMPHSCFIPPTFMYKLRSLLDDQNINTTRISLYKSDRHCLVTNRNTNVAINVKKRADTTTINRKTICSFGRDLSSIMNQSCYYFNHNATSDILLYHHAIIVDVYNTFNTTDLVTEVPINIPLHYFKYADKVVSDQPVIIGTTGGIGFPNIASMLIAYNTEISYSYNEVYDIPLLCNIFEKQWENINPRRAVLHKSTDSLLSYINIENKTEFIIAELEEVRNVACGMPARPNNICTYCHSLLCDEIYVIEIDSTHHWCFCRVCMNHSLYADISKMFNCTVLKVQHPTTIKQAIDTINVTQNVKNLLIEVATEHATRTTNYKNSDKNIIQYLLEHQKPTDYEKHIYKIA